MKFRRTKENKNKRPSRFNFKKMSVLWFVLLLFIFVTVFFTIQGVASGAKLAELEKEQKDLINENKQLATHLTELTSLKNIEEAAEDLGFVKPTSTIYITEERFIAKLP
jgi:cell division protein FtsB